MLGAIAGDIIGSIHEFGPPAPPGTPLFDERSHFTDDTILTLATMRALLDDLDYATAYREAYQANPEQSWGARFREWGEAADAGPYHSFGNGAAMRVSPVGFWHATLAAVREEADCSAAVTHDHPEGLRGAQATAEAIFRARCGESGDAILQAIRANHGYALDESMAMIRGSSQFNETCQGTVPPAIWIACEATDFEEAMTLCLGLDADTDTLACIVGGMVEARLGVPAAVWEQVTRRLRSDQQECLERFYAATQRRMAGADGLDR